MPSTPSRMVITTKRESRTEMMTVHVWTERFLGTRAKGANFLDLIEGLDQGRWTPDKWGHFEPVKNAYSKESHPAMLSSLTEERGGRISNDINFKEKKPRASIYLTVWRGRVPSLNHMWLQLDAAEFIGPDGTGRMVNIVKDLLAWSGGVYATAQHAREIQLRTAMKTPEERLEQMHWLTFFGSPYLSIFGGGRSRQSSALLFRNRCPRRRTFTSDPDSRQPGLN